jgi:tRNA nucleotidyltransferase (CCA-adding enzyme)
VPKQAQTIKKQLRTSEGMDILKSVLGRIKPDRVEILKKVSYVVDSINDELKQWDINAECVLGGSIAKDTFLKGDHDCDLFVKFNLDFKEEPISDVLENVLRRIFKKVERIHGSRDYFQFKYKLIQYEIVPVLALDKISQLVNTTDASPMHVAWIKQFKKGDQIRLAKAFCKGIGVYGAESYVKGFSGHVLDILTVHYGSFLKLLKAASEWEDKVVVDHYNIYKGKALNKLNVSKIDSPLIIIDPIQKERNAAAALGNEKFRLFKTNAKQFLAKPNIKYFKKPTFSINKIKKQVGSDNKLTIIEATPLKGKKDVVGAKLLKVYEHLSKYMKINEFDVIDSGWNWDAKNDVATYYVINPSKILSKTSIRTGPPTNSGSHAEKFKKMHTRIEINDGRLYATVDREFRKPEKLVAHMIKQNYIKEKVKRIKIVK